MQVSLIHHTEEASIKSSRTNVQSNKSPILLTQFRKSLWTFIPVIFLSIISCGQSSADTGKSFNPNELKADFKAFSDSMEAYHAGLYRYISKTDFHKLLDSASNELNRSMRLPDFYLLLRYLVSKVQDGHTSVNMPTSAANHFIANAKLFPFQLHFINDRAFISCKTPHETLKAGSEILSIDNHPIRHIRQKLFNYMTSDGANETKKFSDLNNEGFSPLYYLVFGEKKLYSVKYKSRGVTQTVKVPGSLFKDISCRTILKRDLKPLSFNIKNGIVAILTIRSFSSQQLKSYDEYGKFLQASFDEIRRKKINNLIIDLRNNGGGHDVFGSMLYSYLTDKPFRYYASLESTTRVFDEQAHPNLQLQQPAANNFKGRVFFLINGKSFSSTAEFCAVAKSNERGKFIGEETGGGYYGNTSGASARITLPNSKMTVTIPTTRYTMAVRESIHRDRGIIPDFIIVPGIDDVLKEKDIQLNYALKLAGG